MKMKKRFFGILLGLVMMLGLMPGMVLKVMAEGMDNSVASVTSGETTTYYDTLSGAVNAAAHNNDIITLLSNRDERVSFDNNVTVTLDLNGHTINGSRNGTVVRVNAGTVILDDSSENKGGMITNGYIYDGIGGGVYVKHGATFIMLNGTIAANSTNGQRTKLLNFPTRAGYEIWSQSAVLYSIIGNYPRINVEN